MKTSLFMESTGVYHLPLLHFLQSKQLEVFVINPLITNSNKNQDIRKVKNDKKDALSIAKIGKFQDIKAYNFFDIPTFTLKCLCRDYYKLVDIRSSFKKKLSADLYIVFSEYKTVFSDITGPSSIAVLKQYQTPKAVLDASRDDIIDLLFKSSRKSLTWCNSASEKLTKAATRTIGISSAGLAIKLLNSISIIENLNEQIELLLTEIKKLIGSDNIAYQTKKNIQLLMSISGVGFITAVTIVTEIGDIKGFLKPRQLVAYFGIAPSVNESGKFKSDKQKMSKRGTCIGRRALYAVALASIRTTRNGKAINKVLLDYYQNNLSGKKKKVALVAIMHKLINYIFAVLRDQKEYEQSLSKIHQKMYLQNKGVSAA